MRRLVDARDPADLMQVSQAFTLGMTRDVALYSQTAYTAQGLFGVDLLNLGDPSDPVLVDSLSPGCLVLGTDVHGQRLYVSQLGHKVSIYELSRAGSQSSPVPLGEVQTSRTPISVRVQGTRLLVAELGPVQSMLCAIGMACWPPAQVEVFDLSAPAAPALETTLTFGEAEALFGELVGEHLILQRQHGVTVHGVEDQP